MGKTVKRIELPSGGWWEIETRPRWRHAREWAAGLRHGPKASDHGEGGLIDRVLVSLTSSWSFPLPVNLTSLDGIDAEDVIAVLELVRREVAPFWEEQHGSRPAERLFTSLAAGRVPEEFGEVHIMALTGWSWETLQETPADVVRRMATYLSVREARETGGILDFAEVRHEQ